jgi:hypothetical protein
VGAFGLIHGWIHADQQAVGVLLVRNEVQTGKMLGDGNVTSSFSILSDGRFNTISKPECVQCTDCNREAVHSSASHRMC